MLLLRAAKEFLDARQPRHDRCLGTVLGGNVVPRISQLIGKVLLGSYPVRLIVGVRVVLPMSQALGTWVMRIA